MSTPQPVDRHEPEHGPDAAYDGPAHLLLGGHQIAVRARLSGHFEPLSGRYQWAGRVAADDATDFASMTPNTSVRLRTEHGHEAEAVVRDEDPWGGFRVTGTGRPPFEVPAETP